MGVTFIQLLFIFLQNKKILKQAVTFKHVRWKAKHNVSGKQRSINDV